jgi:hypothetical protein
MLTSPFARHETSLVSLLLLYVNLIFPSGAQCQTNLRTTVADINSQIAELQKLITDNDAHLSAPAGWHWDTSGNNARGVVPDGPSIGVVAVVNSVYKQRDPVTQLGGDSGVIGGLGSAITFQRKYGKPACSRISRIEAYKGYVMVSCTAKDVTDDSLNWFWFAANGYSVENLQFRAPTQTSYNQYEPVIRRWCDFWFQRRSMTQTQQANIAILLAKKEALCSPLYFQSIPECK